MPFEIITQPAPGGAGDVAGPASSTDNAIARYDSTTGKIIQNSSATVDDSGNIISPGYVQVADDAYGAGWNASLAVPTKNAVYDKIETLSAGSGHTIKDENGAGLTARANLNFTGAGVTATDNAGTSATDVTIPGVYSTMYDAGNSGAAKTIDWSANGLLQKLAITENTTLTFTAPVAACRLELKITNGGAFTVAFPADVYFAQNIDPTITPVNTAIDRVFLSYDGTEYTASVVQNTHGV